MSRRLTKSPSGELLENLNEVFRCFICMERLNNAHLCPHCSKLCCYECIVKWLTEQSCHCPHCRAILNVEHLVNCRWLEDVAVQVENLQEVCSKIKLNNPYDRCPNHGEENLSVYCWTCKCCICYRCALWDGQHSGHFFKQIELVYENHVAEITKEISKLRNRVIELANLIRDIQSNVIDMRNAKDAEEREIHYAFANMLDNLDSQLRTKLIISSQQKNTIKDETKKLNSLIQKVETRIKTYSRAKLINQSSELLQMINEIKIKPIESLITEPVSITFPSEVKPKFNPGEFQLKNFTHLKLNNFPVFSEPLKFNGLEWRLKVYPNGSRAVRGIYLSVFIELTQGVPESHEYEYRVKMLHSNRSKIIHREFVSNFDIGECWGFNRFYRLDLLFNGGYLIDDTLDLRFEVRQSTYYHKCRDQEWYTEKLLKRQTVLKNELRLMKQKLIVSDKTNSSGPDYNASDNTNDTNENEGATASFVPFLTYEKNQNAFALESKNSSVLNCDATADSTVSNKKELVTAVISKVAVRKTADYSNNLIDSCSIISSSSNSGRDYRNILTFMKSEENLKITNNENSTNKPTDKSSSGNNPHIKKQTFKIDDILPGITKNVRKYFIGSEGEDKSGELSNSNSDNSTGSNTLKLKKDSDNEDNIIFNETFCTDNISGDDNRKSQKRHDKQQRQHKHNFRLHKRNVIDNEFDCTFSLRENDVENAACNNILRNHLNKNENEIDERKDKRRRLLGKDYSIITSVDKALPSYPDYPLFKTQEHPQMNPSKLREASEGPWSEFDRLLQNIRLSPESKREIHPLATEHTSLPLSSSQECNVDDDDNDGATAFSIIDKQQENLDHYHANNILNFMSNFESSFDVHVHKDYNNSCTCPDGITASNKSTDNNDNNDSTSPSNEYRLNINNDEKYKETTSSANTSVEFCSGERDSNEQPPLLSLNNRSPTLSKTPIPLQESLKTSYNEISRDANNFWTNLFFPDSSSCESLSFQHNLNTTKTIASTPSFILRDKTSSENSENVSFLLLSSTTTTVTDAVGAHSSNNDPTINNSSFRTINSKISNSENPPVSSCSSEPSSSSPLSLIRNASIVLPSLDTKEKSYSANKRNRKKSRKKRPD